MSDQSIPSRDKRSEKRRRLTDLITRLGVEAPAAKIREEAYREGIGTINGHMLMTVRNEVWPDRVKHAGGFSREERQASGAVLRELVPCPSCGSRNVHAKRGYQRANGTVTRSRICNSCGHGFSSAEAGTGRLLPKQKCLVQALEATEKQCTYCKKVLPVDRFSFRASSSVYRRPGCKQCYADKWSARSQAAHLKEYGLDPDAYERMLQEQGGVCAICGSTDTGSKRCRVFAIDHCHRSGKLRGLLCHKCNLGIGAFNDDPERLHAASDYVRRHAENGRR